MFIDLGAVGGLCRVRNGVSVETEGKIADEEGTTGNAHLLPCSGVPRPVSRRGRATLGRRGNCAIECGWRKLGRGGTTAGVGDSVLDRTRGARGGTGIAFELAFVTVGDISRISPSSCGRRYSTIVEVIMVAEEIRATFGVR